MLEPCRRYQSRYEPIAAIPTTRTTRTRRTRRLCVNIETNGAGPLRSRRRRRSALPNPYYMTYPPVYETNPWMCADWQSNEQFYSYGNFVNPVNRLYAGEECEYAPANGFIPPEDESVQEFYGNNSGQKAAGDLRNILTALDGYLEEDSQSKNDVEPDSSRTSEDQSNQNNRLSSILDLIGDTIGRLNNYMTAKSNNHEHMDVRLRALPQPVQVLQLPVQPLILPPMPITNSSLCPSIYSNAMEPPPCPTESRTYFDRPPFPKERKRKRPSKSVSHVYLHSQSCSTDDLDRLPRVLEPSSSRDSRVPMRFFSPPMRDSSTTMYCSMKYCGLDRSPEHPSPLTMTSQMHCNGFFMTPEDDRSFENFKRSPMKYISSVSTQNSEKPSEDFQMSSPMAIRSPTKYSSSVSTPDSEKPSMEIRIPTIYSSSVSTPDSEKPSMEIRSPTKYNSSVSTPDSEKPSEDFKLSSSMEIRTPMKHNSSVSTPDSEKPSEDYEIPSLRTICCKEKCGLVRTHKRKKPSEDFVIPSPMSASVSSSPSLLKAPPPSMKSEDDMDRDLSSYLVGESHQTSTSYSSSCDYHRSVESNLLYSYVEEEKEEQLHLEAGEEILDEDEWYRGASQRLAELEWEQEYFRELQQESQVSMRDKQQQTDDESLRNNSPVNIRVTTDKAVSTTDIDGITNREPVKIVRVYKRSSLKPRQRLTNNNQRERKTKVKFEREPHLQNAPEIITIGRHPMECEDTARTIRRSSRKSSDSPERITIATQDCEDTGRSINRSCRKRSNSTEKWTYREQSH